MKNPIEMLKEIKSVLGIELSAEVVETKLAQMMLENGTVLEAEAFEAGNEVFIVNEEDRIAVPVGEYTMADGRVLYVTEEGLIAEIKTAEAEAEVERARGVAEANDIIAGSLEGNEEYLRYLWINGLQTNQMQVIYVPTEANLPI